MTGARFIRSLMVLGLLTFTGVATLEAQAPARSGFFIGFGFGYGSLGIEDAPERESSMAGYLKLGGALNDRLLLGAESEACAVTGWPVPAGERVDAGGGRGANRADWNAWANAVGTDPWDPATTRY